jgi:hypothetical protein
LTPAEPVVLSRDEYVDVVDPRWDSQSEITAVVRNVLAMAGAGAQVVG